MERRIDQRLMRRLHGELSTEEARRLDELLERGRVVSEPKERARIYREIQEHLRQDLPWVAEER